MKVMILSDSHYMEQSTLLELIQHLEVDYYIHCGDIYMAYEGLPLDNFYIVRGNNDFGDIPKELVMTIDNKVFFITHGHQYFVEYGIDELLQKAKEVDANVLCYGHTHRLDMQKKDNILVINPGSVIHPRNGNVPTYCVLDTNTMIVNCYNAKSHELLYSYPDLEMEKRILELEQMHEETLKKKKRFSFKDLFK